MEHLIRPEFEFEHVNVYKKKHQQFSFLFCRTPIRIYILSTSFFYISICSRD